jgi:murein DD-endopeptidase MepM/ murein hydrolase activator NlpD
MRRGRDLGGWRSTFRTAAVTAVVTSAFWVIGGAIWLQRMAPASPASEALERPVVLPAAVTPSPAARRAPAVSAPSRSGLIVPVSGVRPEQLTDTFTAARSGGRRHDAIDIMAPVGTPVVAAAAGVDENACVSQRGGNTLYIRSPDRRTIYYYAHLDRYAPGLSESRSVRQGEVIGTVGFSGDANPAAPHLHFEIQPTTPESGWWQHQANLNPYPLLGGR